MYVSSYFKEAISNIPANLIINTECQSYNGTHPTKTTKEVTSKEIKRGAIEERESERGFERARASANNQGRKDKQTIGAAGVVVALAVPWAMGY